MTSVAQSRGAFCNELDTSFKTAYSGKILLDTPASLSACIYQIERMQQSECTLILFTRHLQTSACFVIKILQEYQDTRYRLGTLEERQECQLEALRQNRTFTPGVYLGLACVIHLDLEQRFIAIGEIIENPTREQLGPEGEYALIMRQLPEERRLDHLLQEQDEVILQHSLQVLAKHIAEMHMTLVPSLSCEDEVRWGGCQPLEQKLLHNLSLLDLILTMHEDRRSKAYCHLEDRLATLKSGLHKQIAQGRLRDYFERRVAEHRIKHCHGDLKALHIWIMPEGRKDEQEMFVKIAFLDAANFNPSYTHIDILSDLALLAVDIQARTQSVRLADLLIQNYLQFTNQQDEISRAVLAYYLVEKAMVGAAVSIVYDHLPDLGRAFLETAEMRLRCLEDVKPGQTLRDLPAACIPVPGWR